MHSNRTECKTERLRAAKGGSHTNWTFEIVLVFMSQQLSSAFYRGILGLPWWLSSNESTCKCRTHRFDPCSVKTAHAAEKLSPYTATTEPEPVPCGPGGRAAAIQASAPRLERRSC